MNPGWLILWEEAEHVLRQIANLPGWNEAHKIANGFFERHPATDPLRVQSIDLPGQPAPNEPSEAPSSAEMLPLMQIVGSAGDPTENSGSSASPPTLEAGSTQAVTAMQNFELRLSGFSLEVELKEAPADQRKWTFVVGENVLEIQTVNDAGSKSEAVVIHRVGASVVGIERDESGGASLG